MLDRVRTRIRSWLKRGGRQQRTARARPRRFFARWQPRGVPAPLVGDTCTCAPSLAGALVDVVPTLPVVASLATVFAYLGGSTWIDVLLKQLPIPTLLTDLMMAGLTGTFLSGLLLTALFALIALPIQRRMFTSAHRAHPQSFGELCQRVDRLTARLWVLNGRMAMTNSDLTRAAFAEAEAHCQALRSDLVLSGPHWATGTGYIDVLTRLHRAEEALILVDPVEDVLDSALYDEQRLDGARMDAGEHLLCQLRSGVKKLRPGATVYLNEPPREPSRAVTRMVLVQTTVAVRQITRGAAALMSVWTRRSLQVSWEEGHWSVLMRPAKAGTTSVSAQGSWATPSLEARVALREVRRAVNEFRDECRAGLIRSRSRCLGAMALTGVITYVMLVLAIRFGAQDSAQIDASDPIVAATSVYLVGAVVGLFYRLYLAANDDVAVEDYGLSRARLLLTPLLSGLAAVGGVLITGMVSDVIELKIKPAPSRIEPTAAVRGPWVLYRVGLPEAAEQGRASAGQLTADTSGLSKEQISIGLRDVFNLTSFPFALVLAAAFGLTPRLFLDRLYRASEQSKRDLQSTQAHQPLDHVVRAGRESAKT